MVLAAVTAFVLVGPSAVRVWSSDFPGSGGEELIQANEPILFSVTGDIPYGTSEIAVFQEQIDAHDLYSPSEFLVHVGDIKAGSEDCSEDRYNVVAGIVKSSQVPCYLVPGDNETTDCADPAQGWQYWAKYFLGIETNWECSPSTERQSGRPENFAFVSKGMLFLGINLVGGSNSTSILQDDASWVSQQLQAKGSQVRGAVIFAQAGPGSNHSTFFDPFVTAAMKFAKPILYIHGDGHSWILDHPFTATNITRVQVENGGDELPVQVTATLDSQNLFQFKRNPWSSASTPVTRTPCVEDTPMLSISDATVTEGNSGKTNAVFTVSLANPNGQAVTVHYATTNGSAVSGSDYTAISGSLSFSGTTTSRTIAVPVVGETTAEPDESFFVDLSSPTNAGLADGRGQGTIQNNDGTNAIPVARSDDYATNEDVVLNVPAPGVLGNDTDADGNPLRATLQSGTSFGTLSLNANGSFKYTPRANFSGSDEFTYIASDGRGGTATAAVTLSVNPDVPVATGDTWTTPVGTMLTVAAPGVLGNDIDVDGDALRAELVTGPAYGSLALAADGSFSYTPIAGFDGVDGFTYRADDGVTASPAAQVSIGVGGPVSTSFTAVADAFVKSDKPAENHGTQNELHVKAGTGIERSYLRFVVTGLGAVRAARLRLYVIDASNDGGSVYRVANDFSGAATPWTETGLTWANAPALAGTARGGIGIVASNRWVEVDVTDAISGDGTYCFALDNASTDVARYQSREAANKPQLIVDRGNSGGGRSGKQPPAAIAGTHTATNGAVPFDRVFPNPATQWASISYELRTTTAVECDVYNARGQRVRTLSSGPQPAGRHLLQWDTRDKAGVPVPAGIYFVRVELGDRMPKQKVVVQR
jgi:hypothetical protein